MLLAPIYVPSIAFGFRAHASQLSLTVQLTQLMFPFLFCVSVGALVMGILNCRGHFAMPALAPAFFNITLIVAAIAWHQALGIYVLGLGVLLGGVVQLVIQLPVLMRSGFRYRPSFFLRDPGLRRMGKLMLPAVLAGVTLQANLLINRGFASMLAPGGVSALLYAMRIIQFPLGLAPIALSTALFPQLSQLAAEGRTEDLRGATALGLRMVWFLLVPATVGLIVVRRPLVAVLFQYGAFVSQDSALTAGALLYYCLGLGAMGGVMILNRAFYAVQDVVTPLKVSIAVVGVNVMLNLVLIGPLAHEGLALATSLSMGFNVLSLHLLLVRRIGRLEKQGIGWLLLKTTGISAAMGGAIWVVLERLRILLGGGPWGLILTVTLVLAVGLGVYVVLARLLAMPELAMVVDAVRPGRGGRVKPEADPEGWGIV